MAKKCPHCAAHGHTFARYLWTAVAETALHSQKTNRRLTVTSGGVRPLRIVLFFSHNLPSVSDVLHRLIGFDALFLFRLILVFRSLVVNEFHNIIFAVLINRCFFIIFEQICHTI